MGKNKHKRFEECQTFSHLFQPSAQEMFEKDFYLKGKWNIEFFKNDKPIVLEIGCGKGEYTTGLAEKNPEKNYIGIDIKGARLWRGSKTVQEKGMKNVAFIRNKVEFLRSFFSEEEISEIWITFPDPQKRKLKKRLTSARFLEIYSNILKPDGIIHLKTDSVLMYGFTNKIIKFNKLNLIYSTDNLYNTDQYNELTQIKTYYEQAFLKEGLNITYLKFSLNNKPFYENPGNVLK
ncbi:MAG: tRNA (guanosine(46)-N7)-methyltransferase TrmB [Bacteroidales bacterium]|nr:tRNA (guanosine(46)-N7)-methyltransferase TrmB [Bacteroidales bacterium]